MNLKTPNSENNSEIQVYISKGDHQIGPLSVQEVLVMEHQGLVSSENLAWSPNCKDWIPWGKLLMQLVPPPPILDSSRAVKNWKGPLLHFKKHVLLYSIGIIFAVGLLIVVHVHNKRETRSKKSRRTEISKPAQVSIPGSVDGRNPKIQIKPAGSVKGVFHESAVIRALMENGFTKNPRVGNIPSGAYARYTEISRTCDVFLTGRPGNIQAVVTSFDVLRLHDQARERPENTVKMIFDAGRVIASGLNDGVGDKDPRYLAMLFSYFINETIENRDKENYSKLENGGVSYHLIYQPKERNLLIIAEPKTQ